MNADKSTAEEAEIAVAESSVDGEENDGDIPRERWAHILEEVEQIVQKVSTMDLDTPHFSPSSVLAHCDEELADSFLSERVRMEEFSQKESKRVQLYSGCFWGFTDTVRGLLEQGTDPNQQNKHSLWTPLHAAVFQEHEEIVKLLLDKGASPVTKDNGGRTPKDFASASEKIWAHFSALGYTQTPREELIRKGIVQKPRTPSPPFTPPLDRSSTSQDELDFIMKHRSSFPPSFYHYGSSYTLLWPEEEDGEEEEGEEEEKEEEEEEEGEEDKEEEVEGVDFQSMSAALSGDVLAGEEAELSQTRPGKVFHGQNVWNS